MSYLVALPLKGESFLFQADAQPRILVDGGFSTKPLLAALRTELGQKLDIDIVVCTHADADHAGGLAGLLGAPDVRVLECWLPGAWSDVVLQMVRDAGGYYEQFYQEAIAPDAGQIELLASTSTERVDAALGQMATGEGTEQEPAEEVLAGARDQLQALAGSAARVRRRLSRRASSSAVARRAMTLIDAAERIRAIAVAALDNGVQVRWFDFGEFARTRRTGGGEAFLQPVNSQELKVPPRILAKRFYRFIALSRANRECLVFYAPGFYHAPGVLFCGDSPLGDGPAYHRSFFDGRPSWGPVIATAPHHGAESNAMAYGHAEAALGVAVWLRAGGQSHHPDQCFRAIPAERRGCTHCPHRPRRLQPVRITWSLMPYGLPTLTVRSHECDC